MHREGPQLRKACAFDELAFLFAPLRDFAPRVRPAVEQVEARRVADALVVEVSNPRVHLHRFHVIATETRRYGAHQEFHVPRSHGVSRPHAFVTINIALLTEG